MSPDEDKWRFLFMAPELDARNSKLRHLSKLLWAAAGGNTKRYLQLAFTVARDWVRQLPDTDRLGNEDIAGFTREPSPDDAVDALRRGYDDCDAKARLFVALALAAGINARMVPYWRAPGETGPLRPWGLPRGKLAHVAAEVRLNEHWWPVETTLGRARMGELGDMVPKETAGGKWLLS